MSANGSLLIGELARAAGVNIQTIRYYERRRLLRPPAREMNRYRRYEPEAVRVVRFVKHAQALGFSLAEIEELLALRVDARGSCGDVRIAHVAAGAAGVDAEREQLLDFGEREAERLRVLDEPDDAHRLGLVAAVPVHLACRRAKESPALVVPDRLDVDARGTGELADQERAVCRHAASLHPVLWYKVKRVSGSRTRRRDELLVRPRTREQPGREGRGRAGAIPSQCYARGATPVVLPATDSGASPRSRRRGCETRTACDG